jgi:hypothetical protein
MNVHVCTSAQSALPGPHKLKQHPGWTLTQTEPGTFTWTTPAGRTYTVSPDTHPS